MFERKPPKRTFLKNFILLASSVAATLIISLTSLYYYAPQLLGFPADLQMLKVAKEVSPFFEGVFRESDKQEDFIINDPLTKRAKPFFPDLRSIGPNDLLGFRNLEIPTVADIITIGDSMTYGNNAPIEDNWPSVLAQQLKKQNPKVYNMSVGGWGAAEYLEIFQKAVAFQPRVIIVAFYSGNDALDSYKMVYSSDRWLSMRPDKELKAHHMPKVTFPSPPEEWWTVTFKDKSSMTFTPKLRLASNQENPVIQAGYDFMILAAQTMSEIAKQNNIQLIFTLIPTKELAYHKKVSQLAIQQSEDYIELTHQEPENIKYFADRVKNLPNATYVDLVAPLQQAALDDTLLYPTNENGHPLANGYAVIGKNLASTVKEMLPKPIEGLVAVPLTAEQFQVYLAKKNQLWQIADKEKAKKKGLNLENVKIVTHRDIANMQHRGPYLG